MSKRAARDAAASDDQDPQSLESGGEGLRLDAWLWHTRFLRKRTVAADLCAAGRIRVSGRIVAKAHAVVRIGDVLTFPLGRDIRVVRVLALPARRGSAPEMRRCYEDLFPPGVPAVRPDPADDDEDD
jgi:ribosome-associated heat shock protein Hsp15